MALTAFEKEEGRPAGSGSEPAIAIHGLQKNYGPIEAVRGIDLEVPAGELFGFLGPNGAGKSTTIKILCTLLRPTAGEVRVAGCDVLRERAEVRRHIGLVFQEPTLDEYLTAEANLRFHAAIYGMPRASVAARIDQVLEMVGLTERRRSMVRSFSGGMKRRLEIARGLLHSPRVLFLDEPTIGLDPESRAGLWEYVDRLRHHEDITVFLTTHYMDEAERCDRIAIVDQGQIAALDTPAALKASVGHDRVYLTTSEDALALASIGARLGVEAGIEGSDGLVVRVADGETFVPQLFEPGVLGDGVHIQSVRVARPSLDDVFLTYTGNRLRDDAGPGHGAANRRVAAVMGGRR